MSPSRQSPAVAPAHKRKSRRAAAAPTRRPEEIDRQSAELAAIQRMLELSEGSFSFSLAVCNSPALRDHVIATLRRDAPRAQRIAVPPGTTDVYAYVASQPVPADSEALFIVGLEDSIRSEAPQHLTLKSLNASRELWSDRFSMPVVFWLPEFVARLLPTEAPDFSRWFSHQFQFVSESATALAGIQDSFAGDLSMAGNLSADEKRFRLAELEQRIAEAGENPPRSIALRLSTWLNEAAFINRSIGDLDRAEEMHRKALEIEEKLGGMEGMAVAYGNLGLIYQTRGDLDRAEETHRKALEISEKLGQQEHMAALYGNLGEVYWTRGDLDRAEEMLRKSLEIEEKLGSLGGVANDYGNLGLVYRRRGDLDRAEEMHRKSLEISKKLGRMDGMAMQYGNLGVIYRTRGDLDRAEEMYLKSLAIDEKLGYLEGMASDYGNLGTVYMTRGDLEQAREFWTKARDLYARIGMPHMVQRVQGWLEALAPD